MGIRTKRVRLSVLAGTLSLALSGCLGSGSLVSGPGVTSDGATVQNARVIGSVFDPDQNAVPSGAVRVGGETGRSTVIENGHFELELPSGTHEIVVEAPEFAPERRTVPVQGGKSTALTVTLERLSDGSAGGNGESGRTEGRNEGEESRLATLSGQVLYRSSATESPLPLREARITLDGQAIPYGNGGFGLSGIQPGTYQLTVSATHFRTKQISVTLEPGETEQMTINMDTIYSASDLDDLARLVRAEAGGEPYVGQVAVAASTLNRVLSPRYPNTIPGVVYQAWTDPNTGVKYVQYSPVINGTIWQPATPTSRAAVADALAGWDPSLGATGFFNGAKTDNQWVRQQGATIVIGNHAFFR